MHKYIKIFQIYGKEKKLKKVWSLAAYGILDITLKPSNIYVDQEYVVR